MCQEYRIDNIADMRRNWKRTYIHAFVFMCLLAALVAIMADSIEGILIKMEYGEYDRARIVESIRFFCILAPFVGLRAMNLTLSELAGKKKEALVTSIPFSAVRVIIAFAAASISINAVFLAIVLGFIIAGAGGTALVWSEMRKDSLVEAICARLRGTSDNQ